MNFIDWLFLSISIPALIYAIPYLIARGITDGLGKRNKIILNVHNYSSKNLTAKELELLVKEETNEN